MKHTLLIISVIVAGLFASCSTSKKASTKGDYTKTASGMEYRMLYDKPGIKANVGDMVDLHIRTSYEDSLIFDSKKTNAGKPATLPVNAPKFRGDLAEALMLMSPGDSMIARVAVDSLKSAGQRTQPWMKDGGKITYYIAMVSVKTKEDANKEKDAAVSGQLAIDDKLLQQYFKDNNLKPLKTASGLYYMITRPGTGSNAKDGQNVSVNYSGRTMDGNVFDSNLDPKFNHVEPIGFPLGKGQVIRGWDEGLALLNKGSRATFYIPSTLAYGANSPSPAIPANAILIFDVELLDIK